jgi:hypothetical protein
MLFVLDYISSPWASSKAFTNLYSCQHKRKMLLSVCSMLTQCCDFCSFIAKNLLLLHWPKNFCSFIGQRFSAPSLAKNFCSFIGQRFSAPSLAKKFLLLHWPKIYCSFIDQKFRSVYSKYVLKQTKSVVAKVFVK